MFERKHKNLLRQKWRICDWVVIAKKKNARDVCTGTRYTIYEAKVVTLHILVVKNYVKLEKLFFFERSIIFYMIILSVINSIPIEVKTIFLYCMASTQYIPTSDVKYCESQY